MFLSDAGNVAHVFSNDPNDHDYMNVAATVSGNDDNELVYIKKKRKKDESITAVVESAAGASASASGSATALSVKLVTATSGKRTSKEELLLADEVAAATVTVTAAQDESSASTAPEYARVVVSNSKSKPKRKLDVPDMSVTMRSLYLDEEEDEDYIENAILFDQRIRKLTGNRYIDGLRRTLAVNSVLLKNSEFETLLGYLRDRSASNYESMPQTERMRNEMSARQWISNDEMMRMCGYPTGSQLFGLMLDDQDDDEMIELYRSTSGSRIAVVDDSANGDDDINNENKDENENNEEEKKGNEIDIDIDIEVEVKADTETEAKEEKEVKIDTSEWKQMSISQRWADLRKLHPKCAPFYMGMVYAMLCMYFFLCD